MKKIISILLTVTMLLSMFAVNITVSAEEVTIFNEIELNYTRDVMESKTAFQKFVVKGEDEVYSLSADAWDLPSSAAVCDNYPSVFNEDIFMDAKTGFGINAENNYKTTINDIPYQFGVIKSEVNGVADEPGNVIHSADFEGTINIPVDKAPYNNLYMIAWSGKTDNVSATITYNYTDGTTSNDANITSISGGTKNKDDTEYAKKISFGTNQYVKIWIETTTSVPNARVFQHKLTPDSTKILESVTITTQGQEINIFALTATTQSMVVKARLDEIVARFTAEELTEEQLVQIEKDTKTLVDILKGYGIKPTYEAQIATLVAERREELAVNARKENFGVRENTAVELNLFEDIFMGVNEFYGKDASTGLTLDLSVNEVDTDSIYLYKGLALDSKILKEIKYPQATNRKGGTVAMIIEADNYAARANATIKSQLEAGKLVLSNDGRYDFTVAGTKYHLGEIATGKKTGNVFFPGQVYDTSTSTNGAIKNEVLNSAYLQDDSTKKVTSATYSINKSGLNSVNILSTSFANLLINNESSYKANETRGELVPVTVTYSDGTKEEYYIVNGSVYLDFPYAIRVAEKGKELAVNSNQLQYKEETLAVPVGTEENVSIDYLGKIFNVNGNKLLMPKGSEILASVNRLSQTFGTYTSGLGYTYSYEIPVTKLNTTVESVTVGNPVSLAVADMKKLFGSDNVVQDGLAAYIKVDSDAENDYYVGIYSFNEDRNFSGIFAMTTVACSIQEMIDEIEAEVVKAEPDMKKLNDLLTCLETFENFRYEEDLSANAKSALGFVKNNIEITEDSVNKIWATANIMSGEDGIAVVAFYNKDGNLIKTKTAPVSNGSTVEVGTKPEGTVLIKGFLWKCFETLKPLARDTSIDTREYALDNIYYNGQWVTDCQEELNIAFLGDSICYGTAWSTMICDYFEEKTGRTVNMYNASIPGAKSERAAEMLDDAILPLNPDVVIVENYNDLSANFENGYKHFESIIRRLTKQEKQPVIIVYHPNAPYVDGTIGSRYTYEKQYELHTAKDAIAMQYNVKSISFAKYFEQLIADEKAKGTDMAEWLTTYYNSDNTHCTKAGYTLMGDYFIDSLDKNPSAYLVRHNVATIPVNVAADRKYVRTFADNSRFKYTGFAVYTPASDVSGLTGAAAIPAKITKFPHGAIAQTNAEKSVLEFETTAKEISVWYSTAAEKNSTRDVEIYVDGELLNTVTTEKNNVSFIRYIDISLNGGKHKVEIKPIYEEGKVFNFNCLTERY